jgi:GYF domain.
MPFWSRKSKQEQAGQQWGAQAQEQWGGDQGDWGQGYEQWDPNAADQQWDNQAQQGADAGWDAGWDDGNGQQQQHNVGAAQNGGQAQVQAQQQPQVQQGGNVGDGTKPGDYVHPDDAWYYSDKNRKKRGPFSTERMRRWFVRNKIPPTLWVKPAPRHGFVVAANKGFAPIHALYPDLSKAFLDEDEQAGM